MQLLRIPEKRTGILLKENKKNLRLIEKLLRADIRVHKSGEVEIQAKDPLEELVARNVIKAVGRGFLPKTALKLMEKNFGLNIVKIKDFASTKKSMNRLKGRVIGKNGKIRAFLENELEVDICVHGKTISIIGQQNRLKTARKVVELLLNGGSYAAMRKLINKNQKNYR